MKKDFDYRRFLGLVGMFDDEMVRDRAFAKANQIMDAHGIKWVEIVNIMSGESAGFIQSQSRPEEPEPEVTPVHEESSLDRVQNVAEATLGAAMNFFRNRFHRDDEADVEDQHVHVEILNCSMKLMTPRTSAMTCDVRLPDGNVVQNVHFIDPDQISYMRDTISRFLKKGSRPMLSMEILMPKSQYEIPMGKVCQAA